MQAASLYRRARSGSSDSFWTGSPPIGDEGSAGWESGPLPATLILSDLSPPPTALLVFGAEIRTVTLLDLSGNRLATLPAEFATHLAGLVALFLGGPPGPTANSLAERGAIPPLDALVRLQHLSLHDTQVEALPTLPVCLTTLRIDRTRVRELPVPLPPKLATLHLEGCPLPGTSDRLDLLPPTIRALEGLDDLQLPDGSHVGAFFGTALPELLIARE